MHKFRGLAVLVGIMVLMLTQPAAAQDRSVAWEIWDVAIYNIDPTNNSFDVRESYRVRFEGRFTFGSAVIEDTNLEEISNVQVYEGGALLEASCSEQPGTYCVTRVAEGTSINYYFTEPVIDAVQSFEIRYTVTGAIRVYESGDQIWWTAIPDDHFGFPIESSIITVRLPPGSAPRAGIDPVTTYGAPTEVTVFGEMIIAYATRPIQGDESLGIRVKYPHNPDTRIPVWQAEFDRRSQFEEDESA